LGRPTPPPPPPVVFPKKTATLSIAGFSFSIEPAGGAQLAGAGFTGLNDLQR